MLFWAFFVPSSFLLFKTPHYYGRKESLNPSNNSDKILHKKIKTVPENIQRITEHRSIKSEISDQLTINVATYRLTTLNI